MSGDNPKHPQNNATPRPQKNSGEKENTKRHVYVEPGVQVDLVKDLKDQYEADRAENSAHSNKVLFWTRLSAILLLIYVGLTLWQAYSSQQSLDTVREQFQFDERPYITIGELHWMDETGEIKKPVAGQPLEVTILYKNVGKTLALNIGIHRHILFGAQADQIRSEPPDAESTDYSLEPGAGGHTTVVSLKDTFSNESYRIHTPDMVNWDGSEPIVVFGRITYEDVFGNKYCTPYISRALSSGDWLFVSRLEGSEIQKVGDLCPVGKR